MNAAAIALTTAMLAGAAQAADMAAYNNACRTCHSLKAGDNRLGPTLHGIVGREAGSVEGYGYSSAMAGSAVVWDEAALDAFIASPDAVVTGNAMRTFAGIADPKLRAAIVAVLKDAR